MGEGPGEDHANRQTKHHLLLQRSCPLLRWSFNLKGMSVTQPAPTATPAGVTSPAPVQHLEIHRTTPVDGSSAQGAFFQVHGNCAHDIGQMAKAYKSYDLAHLCTSSPHQWISPEQESREPMDLATLKAPERKFQSCRERTLTSLKNGQNSFSL